MPVTKTARVGKFEVFQGGELPRLNVMGVADAQWNLGTRGDTEVRVAATH